MIEVRWGRERSSSLLVFSYCSKPLSLPPYPWAREKYMILIGSSCFSASQLIANKTWLNKLQDTLIGRLGWNIDHYSSLTALFDTYCIYIYIYISCSVLYVCYANHLRISVQSCHNIFQGVQTRFTLTHVFILETSRSYQTFVFRRVSYPWHLLQFPRFSTGRTEDQRSIDKQKENHRQTRSPK